MLYPRPQKKCERLLFINGNGKHTMLFISSQTSKHSTRFTLNMHSLLWYVLLLSLRHTNLSFGLLINYRKEIEICCNLYRRYEELYFSNLGEKLLSFICNFIIWF